MTAKDCLLKVKRLEDAAWRAEERAEALWESIGSITANYEGVRVQGGASSTEDAMAKLADAEKRVKDAKLEAAIYKDMILERIYLLEGEHQSEILKIIYIDHVRNWNEIAARVHLSKRHAQRIHGLALLAFAKIMPAADIQGGQRDK